ncbi:2-keto-4-pentenoate hydratase [Oryzibacter oryziterrae]|uniref:2-keto-4-pentenoate hydratase n=1 Tax=Oryzibacter oryziterrae TaxID=2766474 RepID=UPI001F006E9F|nr:fumarylacetoacetate hydrolase family protein [Oryzibacter oryziterrae]
MPSETAVQRLAALLVDARRTGRKLASIENDLIPTAAMQADAVQMAVVDALGRIGGYKVLQIGEAEGAWGAILFSHVYAAPAATNYDLSPLKVEVEVAFRMAHDLPGKPDGSAYSTEEVHDAVGCAFVAFEILESRLAADPKPAPLLSRADAMGNWGLISGPAVTNWLPLMKSDLEVSLEIAGRSVVSQTGGHPSGLPHHALTWLANALAKAGHGLVAGQVVTTGAFGGGHLIAPGETAIASIEGLGSIRFTLNRS